MHLIHVHIRRIAYASLHPFLFVSLYYFYMPSLCTSQYAQAFYTSWLATGFLQSTNNVHIYQFDKLFLFIYMTQDAPRSLTLSTIIMTSFCHLYIAHPRSTNCVTILHHTSTNRVTILRHTNNNNNNIFPSVYYFHTSLFCLK